MLADKSKDMPLKLIPDSANKLPMLLGRFDAGGIFEIPLLPPYRSGKDPTGPLLLPVAQRDHENEALAEKSAPALVMSKRSPARSHRNASAIWVRHELSEQRKSTFDLIMVVDLYLHSATILSG